MDDIVLIRYSRIPAYLWESEFYKGLDGGDEAEFTLCKKHFKLDDTVNDKSEVEHLLSTLRFWGSTSIPEPAIVRIVQHTNELLSDRIIGGYGEHYPILRAIHFVRGFEPDQSLNKAIEYGSMDLVRYLYEHGGLFDDASVGLAAASGSLSILEYMHEHDHTFSRDGTKAAARMGHLHCLQYLRSIHCPWHMDVGLAAATGGHTLCLKYAMEHGYEPHSKVELCKHASRNCHYECLKYLLHTSIPNMSDQLVHWAADSGSVPCLQVAHNYMQRWPMGIQETIIHKGNLECFIFSVDSGCRYSAENICTIAGLGLLDHLKFIHSQTPHSFNQDTMFHAISHGHLACVQFLHQCGCPWFNTAYANVIRRNDYDCLMFMWEHGAAFSADDCSIAVRCGNLKFLKYLHEHSAYWDRETCSEAARCGHLDCLVYLHEHGCPWDVATTQEALQNNHLERYQYAKKHGCPTPPASTRLGKWFGF